MTEILLICEYSLYRPGLIKSDSKGEYNFTRKLPDDNFVGINISLETGRVLARRDNVDLDDDAIAELKVKERFDGPITSENSLRAIQEEVQIIRDSVSQLLGLIKYYLRHLLENTYISLNQKNGA